MKTIMQETAATRALAFGILVATVGCGVQEAPRAEVASTLDALEPAAPQGDAADEARLAARLALTGDDQRCEAGLAAFQQTAHPFLREHCTECHDRQRFHG